MKRGFRTDPLLAQLVSIWWWKRSIVLHAASLAKGSWPPRAAKSMPEVLRDTNVPSAPIPPTPPAMTRLDVMHQLAASGASG